MPNKLTSSVRDMVRGALDELGGKRWLVREAKKDPRVFVTLVAKLIPQAIIGEDGPPIKHHTTVTFVAAPPPAQDDR